MSYEPVIASLTRVHDPEPGFSDLVRALRRRWKTLLATVLLITLPSLSFAILLAPEYTAVTQLTVAPENTSDQPSTPDAPEDLTFVKTQVSILESRPLVSKTMTALDLYGDAEFQNSGVVSRLLQFAGRGKPASEEDRRRTAQEAFSKQLAVHNIDQTHVIEIAFTASDSAKAAAITNKLAETYIDSRVSNRTRDVERWQDQAKTVIEEQKQAVLAAETQVAELRAKYQITEGRGPVLTADGLEELNRQLIELSAQNLKLDAKLATIESLRSSGVALDALPEAIASPVVGQLRLQELDLARQIEENAAAYGEQSARTLALKQQSNAVAARITAETDRLIDGLRNEKASVAAQVAALETRIAEQRAQSRLDNLAKVEIAEAERDAAAKRALYEELLRGQQQAAAVVGSMRPGARVISQADASTKPTSLSPLSIAAVALVLSALLGALMTLIKDSLDRRVYSDSDLERLTDTKCVGLLPQGLPASGRPLATDGRSAAYGHAVRGVLARLRVAAPEGKVFAVTSAAPSGGKTALAINLTISAARQNKRTLLINADAFSGAVRDVLELVPGAGANGKTITHADSGIDVLPSLPVLSPDALGEMLQAMRESYDFIFVNMPSVLAVSDGTLPAVGADAVVLAVQWARTDADVLAAAMRAVRGLTHAVVVSAFTQVNMDRLPLYGRGFGYHRVLQDSHNAAE